MSEKTEPSLLERMEQLAAVQRKQREERAMHEDAMYAQRQAQVARLTAAVHADLQGLHGKPCPYGVLRVDLTGDSRFSIVAYVHADKRPVAWFKIAIVHGTFDGSDECRNIPYTDVRLWARVYYPHGSDDGTMDSQELRPFNNGGYSFALPMNGSLPEFFGKLAERLAPWLQA